MVIVLYITISQTAQRHPAYTASRVKIFIMKRIVFYEGVFKNVKAGDGLTVVGRTGE